MSQFFTLPVKSIRRETPMAVSILLDTSKHASDFEFEAGQYLNLKLNIAGEEVRRAYSICSAPRSGELRIAVKEVEGGKASTFFE